MRKALGNALLIMGLLSVACGTTTGPSTVADMTITITGVNGSMSYSPRVVTVRAGQKVAWHNSGGAAHTATQDNGAFNTSNIGVGATSASTVMSATGTLADHCNDHPTMVGVIVVTP